MLGRPDHIVLDVHGQAAGNQAAVVCIEHGGEDELFEPSIEVVSQCFHLVSYVHRIGGATVNGHIVYIDTGQLESGAQEGFQLEAKDQQVDDHPAGKIKLKYCL